jgi:hypothetical protein
MMGPRLCDAQVSVYSLCAAIDSMLATVAQLTGVAC